MAVGTCWEMFDPKWVFNCRFLICSSSFIRYLCLSYFNIHFMLKLDTKKHMCFFASKFNIKYILKLLKRRVLNEEASPAKHFVLLDK